MLGRASLTGFAERLGAAHPAGASPRRPDRRYTASVCPATGEPLVSRQIAAMEQLRAATGDPLGDSDIGRREASAHAGTATAVVLRAALATGIALRVAHYLSGRSLWIDEARLALNVAGRSYAGLLRPLDYDQAAAPLFLWAEKLATQVFGVNELALRAFPLLAGIAGLLLFVPLARRLLPGWPGVLAVASPSLAPALIFYSAEAKPYILDFTVALVLLHGTIAWIERPAGRLARLFPWLGALVIWASLPAAFGLAAAAAAMIVSGWRTLRPTLTRMRPVLVCWPLSVALAWVLVYRPGEQNDYLRQFWSNSFLALGQHNRLARLAAAGRDVLWGLTAGPYRPPIESAPLPPELYRLLVWAVTGLAILAAVGVVRTARAWRPWEAVLLLGPPIALLSASALSLYPLSLRLVLVAGPVLYLLLFAGADWFLAFLPHQVRWQAATVAAAGSLAAQLLTAAAYVVRDPRLEAVRPMAEAFVRLHRPSESIYVSAGALPAWVFYTTDWSRPDRERLARFAALGRSDGIAFENAGSRGPRPPGEGGDLRFVASSWTEVVGVASGYRLLAATTPHPHMDRGWLQNEVTRIVAEGCERPVWVIMSHALAPDLLLLSGLEVAGGQTTFGMSGTGDDVGLRRLEFAPATAAACSAVPPRG